MNIGLFLNRSKSVDLYELSRMAQYFVSSGAGVFTDSDSFSPAGVARVSREELYENCDMLLVFGGDGTLLEAVRGAAPKAVPVLGVNLGRLGFLTEANENGLMDVAKAIVQGQYRVEDRMMLSCTCEGETFYAANDVVISRAGSLSLMSCDVFVEGQLTDHFSGDGVILASPTGSTAYSLSAGGPVISPRLDCIVLSPICAHSLRSRPCVLSPTERVEIDVCPPTKTARLDVDGQYAKSLAPGQRVFVQRADITARFVRLKERSFYSLLYEKLSQGI